MWLYVLLTVVVVLLGIMINSDYRGKVHSRGQMLNRVILVAVFLLLFAVSACRIAVGNDYWVYRYQFLMIAQERHVSYEIGFQAVVYLMQLDKEVKIYTSEYDAKTQTKPIIKRRFKLVSKNAF